MNGSKFFTPPPDHVSGYRRFGHMTSLKPTATRLRDEATKARRMATKVSDALTIRLLGEYADDCEEAAARLDRRDLQRPPSTSIPND